MDAMNQPASLYLASLPIALVVFVLLHKRGVLRLPRPFTALMFAAFWPLVAASVVIVQVVDPKWQAFNAWWES